MDVTIWHDQHYTFEIVDKAVEGAEVVASNAEGKAAVKTVVKAPGNSSVLHIPDSILERYAAANECDVAEALRVYLKDAGMTHHAKPGWWTRIEVAGDPELSKWLNTVFRTTKGKL